MRDALFALETELWPSSRRSANKPVGHDLKKGPAAPLAPHAHTHTHAQDELVIACIRV